MNSEMISNPGADELERWWGLSYSSYWTLPRSAFQSMPDEWQAKMVALLTEISETAVKHGVTWPPEGMKIHVELRREDDNREPRIVDDLADYQRGRRRLWPILPPATGGGDE